MTLKYVINKMVLKYSKNEILKYSKIKQHLNMVKMKWHLKNCIKIFFENNYNFYKKNNITLTECT